MLEKLASSLRTSLKLSDMWLTNECILVFSIDSAKELLAFIESNPLTSTYDNLCTALTKLENPDDHGGYNDVDFYKDILQIVNDIAWKIN